MVNESNRIYRQIEKGESVVPQLLITLSLDNRDDDRSSIHQMSMRMSSKLYAKLTDRSLGA